MAKSRRISAPKLKVPVIYKHNGITITYVSRMNSELMPEFKRVVEHITAAQLQLTRLRSPNPAVAAALFQLKACSKSLPENSQPKLVAERIATLSYIMEDTIAILAKLSNSNVDPLKKARFLLRFGQTPKQRDVTPVEATEA